MVDPDASFDDTYRSPRADLDTTAAGRNSRVTLCAVVGLVTNKPRFFEHADHLRQFGQNAVQLAFVPVRHVVARRQQLTTGCGCRPQIQHQVEISRCALQQSAQMRLSFLNAGGCVETSQVSSDPKICAAQQIARRDASRWSLLSRARCTKKRAGKNPALWQ
jgi:hypothetical protein